MPKINNNFLVRGASGNMARQYVYRQRGNSTHIAKMPKRSNKEATQRQEEIRDMFGSAALYAQGAMSSPELKKAYQKKAKDGATAYNVALRDYFKAPKVKSVDTGKYDGSPGSTVVVHAKDDFKVAEVKVSIRTAAGVLVEEGNAILNPLDKNKWIYTATRSNTPLTGTKVAALAKDLPGNTGSLEVSV